MAKYFGIYANSGDVQTALNESALTNPYVAIVSGALDYNSVEPAAPSYIGSWTDYGEGSYLFQVLDDSPEYWGNRVLIATTELYLYGDLTNMELYLEYINQDYWHMSFIPEGGEASDGKEYTFESGSESWDISDLSTTPDGSDDIVTVTFDGTNLFTFHASQDHPLSLNTINPIGE